MMFLFLGNEITGEQIEKFPLSGFHLKGQSHKLNDLSERRHCSLDHQCSMLNLGHSKWHNMALAMTSSFHLDISSSHIVCIAPADGI